MNFSTILERKGPTSVIDEYVKHQSGKTSFTDHLHYSDFKIVAYSYLRVSDFSQCIDLCEQYLLGNEEVPIDVCTIYCSALRAIGRLSDALEAYDSYLQIHSRSPELLNNKANLLIDLGRMDEAEEILADLEQRNPPNLTDVRANLNRINGLRAMSAQKSYSSNTTQILDNLSPSGKSDTFFSDPLCASFSSEEIIRRANPDLAETTGLYHLAHSVDACASFVNGSQFVDEQIRLATGIYKANKPLKALSVLEALVNRGVVSSSLYQLAGDCLISIERFDSALFCYLTAQSIDGISWHALLNIASISMMKANFSMASYYIQLASKRGADKQKVLEFQENLKVQILKAKKTPFAFAT